MRGFCQRAASWSPATTCRSRSMPSKLIVASEVVNDGNDSGQLYQMAKAAKDELAVATLTALADTGYYNGNALKACEEDAIVAYVPQAKRTARLKAQDRISHEEFVYDAE